jgi:hypothetical protein
LVEILKSCEVGVDGWRMEGGRVVRRREGACLSIAERPGQLD